MNLVQNKQFTPKSITCDVCDGKKIIPMGDFVKPDGSGSYWKILDKDGIEMPDDWAGTPRTYDKVKRLLDRLNVNGKHRPYTMVQK